MGLINTLLEQCKYPKGKVGSFMLKMMNVAQGRFVDWAISYVEIKDAKSILDIGCGGGKTIQKLSKIAINAKIYGIDYSEQSVKNSTKKNKEDIDIGRIIVKKASVSSIPFDNDSFDIVTAFETHYFWPDLKNDIREIYRVLKTGGILLIASEIDKIKYHMKSYTENEEMENLLKEIGCTNIKTYKNNNWICFIGIK